jgi:formylglycine-generating enzyme required for sulfatase activity
VPSINFSCCCHFRENVWGTFNQINEQDGEQIRRVGALLRFLGGRGYILSQGWIPHVPTTDPNNLFASYWPLDDADHSAAWTIVNRLNKPHAGPALKNITGVPADAKFYDLYNGIEVIPGADGILPLTVERFGAVLATTKGPEADPELKAFMSQMAEYAKIPLSDLDPTWHYEIGNRVPIARAESPVSTDGMKKIPGGPLRFAVKGIEIEGGGAMGDGQSTSDQGINPYGVDIQYEWEGQPNRFHTQWLNVPEYWLDTTPVTQGAFAKYLQSDKSALAGDRYHYLFNWDWTSPDDPVPVSGNESLPVTYVGIEEARAYCKAMGKRLPREEEWVFAATGGGDSTQPYPWGYAAAVPGSNVPIQRTDNVYPGPEAVGKYPTGASPFGILDMVGNVWQYTDEYQDTHTRSAIMKGGANYRPSSSLWYFPMVDGNCVTGHCKGKFTTNQVHNKYFLMNSRYERCGTIGFRCAADVAGSDELDCRGDKVCGKFDAPAAAVDLAASGANVEWVMWDGPTTVRSPLSKKRISDATSGLPGAALAPCNGTQSTFSWAGGKSAMGTCLANGTDGVLFTVSSLEAGKKSVLSVYAGTLAASAMITATLVDGTETTVYEERVNATRADILAKTPYNLKWELGFTANTSSATLTVNVSSPMTIMPPPPTLPPTPAPAPCGAAMCGTVTKHSGDVPLSSVGTSDWTHYGYGGSLSSVNRKCNTSSLIRPLQIAKGSCFADCPQTFTWTHGGFDTGTPDAAQVSQVMGTPTAIFSGGPAGSDNGGIGFTVDIPAVKVVTSVYVYIGACGNTGVLTAELLGGNRVEATYNYTMTPAEGKSCQWTAIATLTIPPSKAGGARTLSGTWDQVSGEHKTKARNIQFHAIAVDAGGKVVGGKQVPCSHGSGGLSCRNVLLQAAVLA